MSTFDIRDAKTHLPDLLARVEDGETITIACAGKPLADLVPHVRASIGFGGLSGRIAYDADHFDDIDSDVADLFASKE